VIRRVKPDDYIEGALSRQFREIAREYLEVQRLRIEVQKAEMELKKRRRAERRDGGEKP